jgi:hypothetical protein
MAELKNQVISTFNKVNDIFQCKLKLSNGKDYMIPLREDGFIHATEICKIVNKKMSNWRRLNETKELINKLQYKLSQKSENQSEVSQIIEVYKGNSGKYQQGTWIHPELGINLAQWCDPNFALQVSAWMKELIFTGKVELGKEKSDVEIKEKYDQIIENIKKEYEEKLEEKNELLEKKDEELEEKDELLEIKDVKLIYIEHKHKKMLQKKERHKHRKGPCFYLMGDENDNSFCKPGFSGNLTERNVYYSTSLPCYFKILYAVYCPNAKLVEDFIKIKFKKYKEPNKELLPIRYKVNKEDIIKAVRNQLEIMEEEYEEVVDFVEEYGHLMNKIDTTYEHEKKLNSKNARIIDNIVKTTKICACCKEEKEKSEFGSDKNRADGLTCYCKLCKVMKTTLYKKNQKIEVKEKECKKCKINKDR